MLSILYITLELFMMQALCFSRFDLIANGGASLTLHFERAPFMSQERTVWLPWNSFYAMDTLAMKTEENSIPSCDLSGFIRPDPVIISSPLSTFFSDSPGRNPIVPETQVSTMNVYIMLPAICLLTPGAPCASHLSWRQTCSLHPC